MVYEQCNPMLIWGPRRKPTVSCFDWAAPPNVLKTRLKYQEYVAVCRESAALAQ
jgi:hypothetical protein